MVRRHDTLLMTTGDAGSISWQPAQEGTSTSGIIAGGFLNGPRALTSRAAALLETMADKDIPIGYGVTYPFPVTNVDQLVFNEATGNVDIVAREPDAICASDIVAALVWAVSTTSASVVLNDAAAEVIEDYCDTAGIATGSDDDVEKVTGEGENEVRIRTLF